MYLIDTHAFLWFILNDPALPVGTRTFMEYSENICISIATFWEMTIKHSKGRLPLPCSMSKMMRICTDDLRIPILSIKDIHLETLTTLPWIHKDPFDRLIVSQAIAEKMTLLSVDKKIAAYDVHTVWDMSNQ